VALFTMSSMTAQAQALHLDATASPPPSGTADYHGGSSRAPDGSTIGVTARYLTMNGKPWLPVMGELHYSRVPEAEWEERILQMKSAGVNIISTYVIWIHHEEVEGQWDWSGQRDLRHFAELCQKHGMLLYPRLGPWAHAEARNGGLPDWVMAGGPIRQEDPKFMAESKTLYDQAGKQLQGLLWKDGGPVIGVQIENEYAMRGPRQGEEYILALKKMAIASGFDVPMYTVTGWDNAVLPLHEFLPVYGGYPDAPWGSSRGVLPPQEVYAFRFGSRVSGNMGMIGAAGGGAREMAAKTPATQTAAVPFMTAEIGGGMQDTYHRRLIVSADDIASMMPVMLGSGVNLYGSYMFVGGQNPDGKLTTLEESQATHYPTDVPVKSYDFEAPISEYGLERPSLRLLKNWNYFLNDFGSLLAPMPAYKPEIVPQGPEDLGPVRWSVRTDGKAGFLFANNYVRGTAMPPRPQVQFDVSLPGGQELKLPSMPVDLPTGAYFAWPFGLDLGGVPLRYGTAQLMARVPGANGESFVFACVHEVRCELALEGQDLAVEAEPGISVERRGGVTMLTRKSDLPSADAATKGTPFATIKSKDGATVRLLLCSPQEADGTWKIAGGLLQTSADVYTDRSRSTLRQLGDPVFRFTLYPPGTPAPHAAVPVSPGREGGFIARVPAVTPEVRVEPKKPAGAAPAVALGGPLPWRPIGVAQAPADAAWDAAAARWSLRIKLEQMPKSDTAAGAANLFLCIPYVGDEARLATGKTLLDDDFFNGEPWLIGLDRYTHAGALPPLELQVLPMRSDSPVYLPAEGRAHIANTGQTAEPGSVTIVPQYQLQLDGQAER
jgi:beta-galactosidase